MGSNCFEPDCASARLNWHHVPMHRPCTGWTVLPTALATATAATVPTQPTPTPRTSALASLSVSQHPSCTFLAVVFHFHVTNLFQCNSSFTMCACVRVQCQAIVCDTLYYCADCNGHGECGSDSGECECFVGSDCSVPTCERCDHGICVQGEYQCEPGFKG
jgi:hypothetical protein